MNKLLESMTGLLNDQIRRLTPSEDLVKISYTAIESPQSRNVKDKLAKDCEANLIENFPSFSLLEEEDKNDIIDRVNRFALKTKFLSGKGVDLTDEQMLLICYNVARATYKLPPDVTDKILAVCVYPTLVLDSADHGVLSNEIKLMGGYLEGAMTSLAAQLARHQIIASKALFNEATAALGAIQIDSNQTQKLAQKVSAKLAVTNRVINELDDLTENFEVKVQNDKGFLTNVDTTFAGLKKSFGLWGVNIGGKLADKFVSFTRVVDMTKELQFDEIERVCNGFMIHIAAGSLAMGASEKATSNIVLHEIAHLVVGDKMGQLIRDMKLAKKRAAELGLEDGNASSESVLDQVHDRILALSLKHGLNIWNQLIDTYQSESETQKLTKRLLPEHVRSYALSNFHEFFACLSEAFFLNPNQFKSAAPQLFEAFCGIYEQIPKADDYTWSEKMVEKIRGIKRALGSA